MRPGRDNICIFANPPRIGKQFQCWTCYKRFWFSKSLEDHYKKAIAEKSDCAPARIMRPDLYGAKPLVPFTELLSKVGGASPSEWYEDHFNLRGSE